MTDFNSLIIIMLGFIFIYCDAPFIDEQQPYIIIRAGRNTFVFAQTFYILISSLTYTIFVFVSTVICSLPRVEFSSNWGKIFKTLAFTNAASQFGVVLNVSDLLMTHYSAITAIVMELLLIWLIGIFLGLMVFVLNINFPRVVGIGCASFFVFLDMFADFYRISHGYSSNLIYFFSPVSWANLTILKFDSSELQPSFSYALFVLILLISILILMGFRTFKKKAIDSMLQM